MGEIMVNRMSKSMIKCYDMCPLWCKFQYINKLTAPVSVAGEKGRDYHKKFEEFFNSLDKPEDVLQKAEMLETDIHIQNFLNFVRFLYTELEDKENIRPIAKEIKIYDKEKHLVGVIDAVFKDNDKIIVLDWKTGKYDEKELPNYRFELGIYTYLWNREIENPESKFRNFPKATHWAIFFSVNGKLWLEPINETETKKALQHVEEIKNKMGNEEFEPKIGKHCSWCPYPEECSEYISEVKK